MRDKLHDMLESFPGVFSTPQWGGRAYKVGSRRKPKLFAFVYEQDRRTHVEFKLPPAVAKDAVRRHKWLVTHPWKTLGPSGWVQAKVTRAAQVAPLRKLLTETRKLYPMPPETEPADTVAAHIDRVMRAARERGLRPRG